MYHKIKQILDSTLACDVLLEIPKDSSLGHFATPLALILAKNKKQNPTQIANEIIQKLSHLREFKAIKEMRGFINFALSDEFLSACASDTLKNPNDFIPKIANEKILLEFVSANPTGPLHIGHARGAIFGDILARIGSALGYKITKEYYINDAGNQISMLGYSIFKAGCEIFNIDFTESSAESTDFYKGDYINDIAKRTQKKFGKDIFLDSSNIPKLAEFGKDEMLDLIKQNLKNANIEFDNFISEKAIQNELDSTLAQLKNAIYEKEGKIWLKSSLKNDEKDRVIVRENGEPTYLAGDIIYHNNKFLRHFDRYINIWGADHHGYIARIKACVEFLGYDSNKLEVILSQMVSLLKDGKPFKMSKRAGNFILMQDVIDEISSDCMRFNFITKKSDTHLEFDISTLKKEDANNGIFYINYANARIHTLFSKSSFSPEARDLRLNDLDSMWSDLLFNALLLPRVLEGAFKERALQKLPEYLKNLAAKLHFCYNSSRILGSECEKEILCILKIVSISLEAGLSCMGIKAKTKM